MLEGTMPPEDAMKLLLLLLREALCDDRWDDDASEDEEGEPASPFLLALLLLLLMFARPRIASSSYTVKSLARLGLRRGVEPVLDPLLLAPPPPEIVFRLM